MGYNDLILTLQEDLKAEFWRLAQEHCTPRQLEVLQLTADGYTQMEIAKKLNINQSSVTKSIYGNCDYRGEFKPKVYGGAVKKLKRLIATDPKIQAILTQLTELDGE